MTKHHNPQQDLPGDLSLEALIEHHGVTGGIDAFANQRFERVWAAHRATAAQSKKEAAIQSTDSF